MHGEILSGNLSSELVGESPSMLELREELRDLAANDFNLLLLGETGTGKELVARLVHRMSRRCEAPFVGVNCAALHESLLQSEMFGHEEGAFTGAAGPTLGYLRAADGGTILLDEIGDMNPSLQTKLLRVLEESAVVPLGGTRVIPVNVRVISATHLDLDQAVRAGEFRRDLYYRLNVVKVFIPPLRERREDIPLLARAMVRRIADALGLPARKIAPSAMKLLMQYDWPGNVRELGNVIKRAYVFGHHSTIVEKDLPDELHGDSNEGDRTFPTLYETVGRHVKKALAMTNGAKGRAANMLDIDRKTLRRMIRRYDLESDLTSTRSTQNKP
jgi:transcriptional regulator with PAS, ATPase and Fis domain